jgi:hypothetical protein
MGALNSGRKAPIIDLPPRLSLAHEQILRLIDGTPLEPPMSIDEAAAYLRTTTARAREIEREARARLAEIGKPIPGPTGAALKPNELSFEKGYKEMFQGRPAARDKPYIRRSRPD